MQTSTTLRNAAALFAMAVATFVSPALVFGDDIKEKVLERAKDECRKKMRDDNFTNIDLDRGKSQKHGARIVFNATGDRNGTNLSVACIYNTRSKNAHLD